MSADNYLLIRNHPSGGYAVIMGFASDENVSEVSVHNDRYLTLESALAAATQIMREEIVEYGISVHSEVDQNTRWHGDHVDYPPYCPKSPTVQVVEPETRVDDEGFVTHCYGEWHVMVGQGLGCACGAVVKRK